MQPLMMPFDLAFYSNGTYTVDSYLSTLTAVYGGIDSVLLWPTYTKYGPALCCAARTCAVLMVCCAVRTCCAVLMVCCADGVLC